MSEAKMEANDKEFVKDGYVNLPASLGEASPLQSSGDYLRSGVSRDYELLTVLYRENWIAKRIIDMPCEDMTREWYSLSTELKQNLIDKIKKVEAKHNVKGEITNCLRWARLYGGSLALIVIKGQEDMLDEPLDFGMIMPGSFKGLLVLDMVTGITPSIELEKDMDDPDFGLPMYYDVVVDAYEGEMVRIHHSRVLRFIGRDLPPQEEIRENYWGASELEHIYEELQKRNATSANIAQLVFQANTRVLKMADYGEVIGMGTNKQKKEVLAAIEAQNRLLTSFGVQIMGTEDNMENHPYSFSGISEVYESFMMDMAGAANIPATKLFGRSPQGMNATGESDMNNYYESIAQMQERMLRPALEKLLPIMCMSIFGAIPNDMEIVFEPIATTTPEQRANISGQFTGTVIEAFSAGLIGRKTALMELKEMGKDIGAWTKISDETIEEADDEVDNGEMGGGEMPPDGGEMPMMPGMAPTEQPPEEPPIEPPEENPEGGEEEPSDEEIVKKIVEEGKDGGIGSGNFNHPGYKRGVRKAGVAERVGFIANPTANIPEPKRQARTNASVEKANKERKDWYGLTTHQKVKGNAEQEAHMRKVKGEVYKAAIKGDMEKAKALVRKNRHYFSNDPDSAMKVQSETLARQKKVKPSGFVHDLLSRLFNGKDEAEDSEEWRTTEEGNHFKLETTTGEIKAGFGGKSNGRIIGSGKKKEVKKYTTPKQEKKLNSVMKKIANYKNEQSFIIGKNGEILAHAGGDKHSVGMSVGTYREHMRGNIGLHNHPGGGTFSPDDLRSFGYGAKEIHVVGPDGHYALRDNLDIKTDREKVMDIHNYGWLAMQEHYLSEVPQEMSYGDLKKKAEQKKEIVDLDKKMKGIADKWVDMRKNGASDEELNAYYRNSGYEDMSKERKDMLQKEIRRLEVAPAHEWFTKNAEKFGFSYEFTPGKAKNGKDENPNHDPENGQFTTGSGSGQSKEEEIESLKSQISKLSRFGEAGKKRAELTKQLAELTGEGKKSGGSQPKPKAEKVNMLPERNFPVTKEKESQFDIIQKSNPMHDDIHTGIRKPSDIMSPEEAFNDSDENAYVYPDFTREDGKKALETGVVTVYSSHPIENGGFVTPSKMMASDYAGNGKVYSKEIPVDEVAWINAGEGQYARVGTHPNKVEIRDAASNVVSGGFKKGIDKNGMNRHRNKESAEREAKKEYEKAKKKYDNAVASGKTPKHEPVLFPKSYFDGVNADFIMRKSLEAMANDKFDNRVCKWYDKKGGEQKCQLTFTKEVGFTTLHGSEDRVPTRTVTVTYSKENGFHCYPDEKKG